MYTTKPSILETPLMKKTSKPSSTPPSEQQSKKQETPAETPARQLREDLVVSGLTVREMELHTDTTQYEVSFVPRRKNKK